MIDLQNRSYTPTLAEIGERIGAPLFPAFCEELQTAFRCAVKIEFSGCSLERGWNVKFKRSGRTLCTVYPREGYFTAMVVVGRREKEAAEALLPDCVPELREIYERTREGNGQRWLMIDLEDPGALYQDVLRLLQVRAGA